MKKKWYQKNWAIVLLLLYFFPVGLYLMWKSDWSNGVKKGITAAFVIGFLILAFGGGSTDNTTVDANESQSVVAETDEDTISQEEAIKVMEQRLDHKLKNTYATEKSREEFRNFIGQYKDYEIGDVCYDIYLNYLYKCDNDEEGYASRGYETQLDILNSMKQVRYSDEQMAVLNDLESILNKQLGITGNYPDVCYGNDFEFSRHSVGYSLSAYAVWEEDSNVEGYQCVMFTDYTTIYDGYENIAIPSNNDYYMVYMPTDLSVGEGVWNFEDLFLVGSTEMKGRFTVNVPIYLYAPYDYDGIVEYAYDMEERHQLWWEWTDTINSALGREFDETEYEM